MALERLLRFAADDGAGGSANGGGAGATPPPNGSGADDEQLEGSDAERLREAIRKERQLRRELEREVAPLRQRVQQVEEANKTDLEKAQGRIQALEGQLSDYQARERTYALRDAISEANRAQGLGIVSERAALRLLEPDAVEWDNKGRPTNVTQLLKELIKAEPYLTTNRRMGSGDGGQTGGGTAPGDMNTLLRRAAGRA